MGEDYVQKIWEFLKDKIDDQGTIDLVNKYLPDQTEDGEAAKIIADIAKEIEEGIGDEASILDVIKTIAGLTDNVMEVAEACEGITGAEKKQLVQGLLWGLYKVVDKGLDGTKNRVDIPWVPDAIEVRIEKKVAYLITEYAIEASIKLWKKYKG
jgi:hypothetical protein